MGCSLWDGLRSEAAEEVRKVRPPTAANGAQAAPSAKDWTRDDRLIPYISKCAALGHFNRDTSDMLPVLVKKLQNSQRDVLRNVREELARSGEPAMIAIDRLVRRLYGDRHSAHTIANALGVVQMSPDGACPIAQELLRSCLGHPQDTVRNAAIQALAKHAKAPLYDDMLAVLRISTPATRSTLLTALYVADRRRAERDIASWIAEGSNGDLMEEAARLVAAGADAETAALFGPLLGKLEDRRVLAFFSATQDHATGDSRGVPFLEELLASDDPLARADGLMALERTARMDLVAKTLTSDPDVSLRLMACAGLVASAKEPLARKALSAALYDEDSKVREESLSALLAIGDAQAIDTAIELWNGNQHDIGIATRAVAGHWAAAPQLGARVFEIMKARIEERSDEELFHKEYLIQALAQVPGPESSEYLLRLARTAGSDVKGLSAHRFLTLQISNTGTAGHEVLRTAWSEENDPELRFDLLWAGSLSHDQATQRFLLEVLQAERSLPQERLWVAERLAREGPASEVAPLLKRATLRMSHRDFRPAMECLLWRWYG